MPIEIAEQAALANFTVSWDVTASLRDFVLSMAVPTDAMVVTADQLFECRDTEGTLTSCRAEIHVTTDCYPGSSTLDELRLQDETSTTRFL